MNPTREELIRKRASAICKKFDDCKNCPLNMYMWNQEHHDQFKNRQRYGMIPDWHIYISPTLCELTILNRELEHMTKWEQKFILRYLDRYMKYHGIKENAE